MEFAPLDDYGFIGNDDRCALVSRDGSIDWCCFPHLESPSLFAMILDPEVGGRIVGPAGGTARAKHYPFQGASDMSV